MQTKKIHQYLSNTYTFTKKFSLVSMALCACVFGPHQSAMAQGVLAGTNISNIATVNYTIANVTQEPIESSPTGNNVVGTGNGTETDFLVDRKIDVLVTGNTNANINPGDTQSEVTFSVENQGNAIQELNLIADSLITGDNFDINNCVIETTAVSGTPLAGLILPTVGTIKLSPDQEANVSVRCDIPLSKGISPILTGESALLSLTAIVEKNEDGSDTIASTNTENPTTIETVFADGAGSDDIDQDASHSARREYIASTATADPELTINKTVLSVVDPNGSNRYITGSEVTYKIDINTTGIGTINNLVVTDTTPAAMTYKLNSIQVNNASQTDNNDTTDNTDFGITTVDTATVGLGDFTAGSSFEILVTYIIN